MGFPRSKIDTDYLLSPDGVFHILAITMTVLATILATASLFFFTGNQGNSGLYTSSTLHFIRVACVFSLIGGGIIFLVVLFKLTKDFKPFPIIDAIFCFLFALLLLVVGILAAVTVWTSCSVFSFLAAVAWIFAGVMATMQACEGGKVGP